MAFLHPKKLPSISPPPEDDRDSSPTEAGVSVPPSTSGLALKRRKAVFGDVLPKAGNDTYHWLKYGEKLLRDRKTLRHYYRCGSRTETGCNAKKMVDVMVTTGACSWHLRDNHNHPAPASGPSLTSAEDKACEGLLKRSLGTLLSSAASGVVPLISSTQDLSSAATSAAFAAALLMQAGGDRRQGSALLSPESGTSSKHPLALPSSPLGPFLAASSPAPGTSAADNSASPLPQRSYLPVLQQQHQNLIPGLAACLSSLSPDTPQRSLSQDVALSLEDLKRAAVARGMAHFSSQNPSPGHSTEGESDCREWGRGRALLTGLSRLSSVQSSAVENNQEQAGIVARRAVKRPADLSVELRQAKHRHLELQLPPLEPTSACAEDHESEDSLSVEKERTQIGDLQAETHKPLTVLCSHRDGVHSCTWLALGSTGQPCSCYS